MRRNSLLVLGAFLGLGLATSASTFSLTAAGGTEACSNGQCVSTPFSSNSQPTNISVPSQSATSGGSTATIQGSVNYGFLAGFATATGDNKSVQDVGSASLEEFWTDTITVTSPGLAPGTLVDLLFGLTVNVNVTCTGSNLGPSVTAAFSAGSQQISLATQTCQSLKASKQLQYATFVGDSFSVEGQLLFDEVAGEGSSITVDPPSSEFFIDALTSDASYSTASGNTYFSPRATPEPSSLMLLGTALAGFAGVIRRRLRT